MKRSVFLFPILFLALLASAQERRPLEIDDMFAIKSVGSPVVSPDGQWIAYTVSETSLEDEDSETQIWMIPSAGGDAIPLTAKGSSAGSPGWSPDGRFISFTASRDDSKSQVWVLDRRGGEAQQLTKVKQGIGGYQWSPDASKLLLTVRDAEEPDTLSGARGKTTPPYVIDRIQFKRDY
ncbi:MAG: Tol biopolymer transport system component, partial [Rhodothermales bacterium]